MNAARIVVLSLLLCSPALVDAAQGAVSAGALAARLAVAGGIAAAADLLLAGMVLPARDVTHPAADDAGQERARRSTDG